MRPSVPISPPSTRLFSTTPTPPAKSGASRMRSLRARLPPYPYAPHYFYKASNFGLYGASTPQSGHQVSKKNEIKTLRTWRPNIHTKRLFSEALGRFIRVKVQARVLRTIDKEGGIDEYLLGEKAARVKELGLWGWRLRWRLMQTELVRGRFREQRREMGLVGGEGGRRKWVGMDGREVGEEAVKREVEGFDRGLDEDDARAEPEGEEDESLGSGRLMPEDGAGSQRREVLF